MTSDLLLSPSRGRLFKLFTDLGPYFRKLQSTENSFFFDCLDICIDDTKEPEERQFYGWWLIVTRDENGFDYERYDGVYNLEGDWVVKAMTSNNQQIIDASFDLFIERLKSLIEVETGFCLAPLETALTEA
jgi:sigma factor-binding protein Crl